MPTITMTTTPKLTSEQREALRRLVFMRRTARQLIHAQEANKGAIRLIDLALVHAKRAGDKEAEALHQIALAKANEVQLELKFKVIEVGLVFMQSCSQYDRLPREVWLRALSVNESEWESPLMLDYGDCVRNVVAVLKMENSATGTGEDFDIVHKPLHWCCTMAKMNASQTNSAFGKAMHNISNSLLDGTFGEWKEPTMLERIGVRQ